MLSSEDEALVTEIRKRKKQLVARHRAEKGINRPTIVRKHATVRAPCHRRHPLPPAARQ